MSVSNLINFPTYIIKMIIRVKTRIRKMDFISAKINGNIWLREL